MAKAPGTVTNVASSGSVGALSNTTAFTLDVTTPGTSTLSCTIRVTEPNITPATRACAFGVGGFGQGWWEDNEEPGSGSGSGLISLQLFQAMGIKCIQVNWGSPGWWSEGVSWKLQGSRGATLYEYIRRTHCPGGKFAVCGNSGSSSLTGYGLTTYGLGEWVDSAIACSGPIHCDIRNGVACGTVIAPWSTLSDSEIAALGVTWACGTPNYVLLSSSAMCPIIPAGWTNAQLLEDSVLHSAAELAYPHANVHVILGGLDCSSAARYGVHFYQQVRTARRLVIVQDAPHWTAETAAGRQAIADAINWPRQRVVT